MSPTRRELVRATRARILEAAARLTKEQGPNGYSMDVLAKEAGVARATVYEHFRSKRAVLDALASSAAGSVTLEPTRNPESDPLRALRSMLAQVCRHWATHHEGIVELRQLRALTGVSEDGGECVDHKALRRLVEDLSRSGQLRQHWSRDDAADALAVLTSFSTYDRLCRDRGPEQVEGVLAKLAVSLIAPGAIGAPPPGT